MGERLVDLPGAVLRGLEKAISMQQAPVAGYVARLRQARPNASPAEIVAGLEKRYLATVTGTGAAVGGVAAAPGVGTGAALALSGGETAVFLEATVLFALAVAEIHGVRVDEVERRRTLVFAVVLGDRGAMLVEKMIGRTSCITRPRRQAGPAPDSREPGPACGQVSSAGSPGRSRCG